MRKAMVLFVGLVASAAFASSEPAEGEKEDVAGYILHHVSDSPEYEFEVPLSNNHIPIHLPQIFIPLKAGACDVQETDHGAVVPGLGAGCLDLSITKHTVMMWLAMLLLIATLLIWSNRDKTKLVPRGTGANLFEMLVLFVRDELAIKNIGKEEGPRYVPYLLSAFFFILFMNLLGLFPWMASATGNIAVTCGLAICTFVVTQIAGIRAAGLGGYLAHLTGGVHWALWPIMVPVEILGLDATPSPGDALAVVEDEARARELTEYRERKRRESQATGGVGGASLVDMMAKLTSKKISELPVVLKADVGGSVEAIASSLQAMGNEEVRARIIHQGVGGITESDVLLAKGSGAPIIGFNVRASKQARDLAEREGVEIRYYAIIYDLLDDIRGVLSGMLAPMQREDFLGNATVLEVFDITKAGRVAGCRVTEGVVRRGARVRIVREDVVVLELGVLQTLKRFKDDVAEVGNGVECGMRFEGFQDIKVGDTIECFTLEAVARTLAPA